MTDPTKAVKAMQRACAEFIALWLADRHRANPETIHFIDEAIRSGDGQLSISVLPSTLDIRLHYLGQ